MKSLLTITLTILCLKAVFLVAWTRSATAREKSFVEFATSYFDAAHYSEISRKGYGEGDGRPLQEAFLPVYPLTLAVLRGVSNVTGVTVGSVAVGANFVLSIVGGLLLFAYLRRRYSDRVAELSVVLLFLSPAAAFFDVVYPEALYLFVIGLVLLVCLERGTSSSRVALGAVAGLCHPQGIATSLLSPSWSKEGRARVDALWLAPLIAVILYVVFVALRAESPLAFLEAQKRWGRFTFEGAFAMTWLDASYLVAAAVAFLVGARKLEKSDRWFFLGLAVFPILTGSLISFGRFCAVSYPLALIAALFLVKVRSRAVLVAVFVVLAIARIVVQRQMLDGVFLG